MSQDNSNPLDRPIWSALTTRQSSFARGTERALAYRPEVEPFAAARDYQQQSLESLASLAKPGDFLAFIQADEIPLPPGLEVVFATTGVQMVAMRAIETERSSDIIPLCDGDSEEMLALAELTKPGPFRSATHTLGRFWGIRREGRLVAMAGERFKLPKMTEVSGVCTHPDWRGHGLAAELSKTVAASIQARGETPFLHAFSDNEGAIRLYRNLGFALRSEMVVRGFALPR